MTQEGRHIDAMAAIRSVVVALGLGFVPTTIESASVYGGAGTVLTSAFAITGFFSDSGLIQIYPTISNGVLAVILMLSLPSQYYFYKFQTTPKWKPVKRRFLSVLILTSLLSLFTPVFIFLPIMAQWSYQWSYCLIWYYPAVVMFAMVVVPVFMRETTMILERDLQRISPLDLGAALKQKQRINKDIIQCVNNCSGIDIMIIWIRYIGSNY